MDKMKLVPVKMTPDLKKAISDGEAAGKAYKIKRGDISYYQGESDFVKKNPKIESARPELKWLFKTAWEMGHRFLVVECERSKERQEKLKKKGASQTTMSQHNYSPSKACDFVPRDGNELLWEGSKALRQYAYMIGLFRGLAVAGIQAFGWTVAFESGRDWGCEDHNIYNPTTLADWAHVAMRDDGRGCTKDKESFSLLPSSGILRPFFGFHYRHMIYNYC